MKFLTCSSCDQLFIKVNDKQNPITCCDVPVEETPLNSKLETSDPHYPTIRKIGNFVTIIINEAHPMNETHHITTIFLETNQGYQLKHIEGDDPKADFILAKGETITNVYVHCNVHLISALY